MLTNNRRRGTHSTRRCKAFRYHLPLQGIDLVLELADVLLKASDMILDRWRGELAKAVADFGLEELTQMLDAAEAIRRVRRL